MSLAAPDDVPARERLPATTDRIRLGGTEVQVSPVCIGMTASNDTYTAAFDAGINFFFLTTDMHWPLYEGARRSLVKLLERTPRDEVVVAATCYPTQPEFCSVPFLELIDSVPGLDHIDVAVAGGVYQREWALRAPIYADHRSSSFAGTRAIGATFHDRKAVVPAIDADELDLAFLRFNPAHLGARREVFAKLRPDRTVPVFNFKSTIGYRPDKDYVAGGYGDIWLPDITDYYRFALSHDGLDGLLCAVGDPSQVDDLVAALAAGPLDEADQNHLIALTRLDLD